MSDKIDAFIYATSKLQAAAVLAATFRQDWVQACNLGFISAAYTATHESMELLLKVYLRKGPLSLPEKYTHGHSLVSLFKKWDERDRTKAELAYQRGVLEDLEVNRISRAAAQATLNIGRDGQLPPDYGKRKAEYHEAFRQYKIKLLQEGDPTVRDVVCKLDGALGARKMTWLCESTLSGEIKGIEYKPEAYYPDELLSEKWCRFTGATRQGESLGFVEAFLEREGTKLVFEGWRYLDEMILERKKLTFQGPPAKMILMAEHLSDIVHEAIQ